MNASYSQVSTGAVLGAQNAVRENTALEVHMNGLQNLCESLAKAVTRAERAADRLFGSEPTPISKGSPPTPAEPPLVGKIEERLRIATDLADSLHRHMDRLERL